MFQVDIEESDDPILNVLQAKPSEVFGRPFAGYILFLFGSADEEVATWFSRALLALDSLTGEDIACVVFARRVRVRSEVHVYKGPGTLLMMPHQAQRTKEGVLLDSVYKINRRARTLVDDGVSTWSTNQREITAVTYAVDDVARELSVVDKLPCLVFIDAVPQARSDFHQIRGAEAEVISLQSFPKESVIPLLRRVVQGLRAERNFNDYTMDVRRIAVIEDEQKRLRQQIANLVRQVDKNDKAVEAIREALLLGSRRMFEKALSLIPSFDLVTGAHLSEEVAAMYRLLNQYHSTIRSLTKYSLIKDRQFCGQEEERLRIILNSYVRPLVEDSFNLPEGLSAEDCRRIADELSRRRDEIINPFVQRLSNELDIRVERDKDGKMSLPLSHTLEQYQAQFEQFQKERNELLGRCISDDHPSLVSVVRRAIRPDSSVDDKSSQRKASRWDFFISHAGADLRAAEILYEVLSPRARVFLDSRCINYGDDWDVVLANAQRESRITLVLISPNTESAYYQREEIAAAIDMARRDKDEHRVVPIFLSQFDLNEKGIPFGLRLKHSLFLKGEYELRSTAASQLWELL